MKIVERIGDFVIKETNEEERKRSLFYSTRGSIHNMENYYIYTKDKTAKKYADDFVDYCDTLEEAKEIVEREQLKKDFNIIDFAKKIEGDLNWSELNQKIDSLNISYKLLKVFDHFYQEWQYELIFDISEYSLAKVIRFIQTNVDENRITIKILGVY